MPHLASRKRHLVALTCPLLMAFPIAYAEETTAPPPSVSTLGTVTVIGSQDAIDSLPGSGAYLDESDLRRHSDGDVHRALREVPGVTIREEDGYGIFPNISLRGADPGRSSKLTIMEDGILMAPAPYAAPAVYYSPSLERMSGVEILKGSSQVRFGPHTTGGVLNYLSTPIPVAREGYVRTAFGTDNELRSHVWLGDQVQTAAGSFGVLAELHYRQTDGFKEIDAPLNRAGPKSDSSGFTRIDPNFKFSWTPATSLNQRVEFSYGRTEMDFDETYLGITTADLRATPDRRYVASQFDNIRTEHERTVLRYSVSPADWVTIDAAAYRIDFARNWDKIRVVNGVSLGQALAGSNGGDDLATLRGERAGTWGYRDNNRDYYSEGGQIHGTFSFATGDINHTLRTGVRHHSDEEGRFQRNSTFTVDDNGIVVSRSFGAPGSQDNRDTRAEALAVFAENTAQIGKLGLTVGVRMEDIDWKVANFNSDTEVDGGERYYAGGVGLNYALSPSFTLLGGIFQGFSPPAPADGINGEDEEKSLSYELGIRHRFGNGIRHELIGFITDFDNLLVPNNAGASGAASELDAVGEVDVVGVEYQISHDLGAAFGADQMRFPIRLAATYTRATIANDSNAGGDPESIFSGGFDGATLPYTPKLQGTFSAGVETDQWSLFSRVIYVDSAFATALNSSEEVLVSGRDATTGELLLVPDARGGKVDSHVLVDLSARYTVSPTLALFANTQNLLDRRYLASRLPEGPRPGAPRTLLVGFEMSMF